MFGPPGLKVQTMMAQMAWWQEREAAAHMAFAVRKQRDGCWCSAHLPLFILPRTPVHGMVLPTVMVGLHSSTELP